MLDLDAIRARLAASTPGPWEFHDDGGIYEIPGYLTNGTVDFMGIGYWNEADAAFIAAAPVDIDALLAVVTRLHAALAALETQAAATPPGSPRYEALDAQLELLYQIAGAT